MAFEIASQSPPAAAFWMAAAIGTSAGNERAVKCNITTSDPTVSDDNMGGWGVLSLWINTSSGTIFQCADASTGAAVWVRSAVTSVVGGDGIGIVESPTDTFTFSVDEAIVELQPFGGGDSVTTGDQAGGLVFRVPAHLNAWDLVEVAACHMTAGTGGTATSIQVHNITQAADMLTTALTIDVGELDSKDAAAAAAIDTANDDVATGDQIRVDVDNVPSSTAPLGLLFMARFKKP